MSLLSKLFGLSKGAAPAPDDAGEDYKGCVIFAEPIREGSIYRIAARIEARVDGQLKVHQLIRADTLQDQAEARTASIEKAKKLIDEQGLRLFDR